MIRLKSASIISAIVCALGLALPAATAQASGMPHSSTGHHSSCTWKYDWGVKYGGSPQYGHADWESVCGDTIQVLVYCYNLQAGQYTRKSGIVTRLELNDQATCYAGDSVMAMYIRIDSGNWVRKWQRSSHIVLTSVANPATPAVTCTSAGAISDSASGGPPATASAWWTALPQPEPGCQTQLRVEIWNANNVKATSGWLKSTSANLGKLTTATENNSLSHARVETQYTGLPATRHCLNIYPSTGSWHACTN